MEIPIPSHSRYGAPRDFGRPLPSISDKSFPRPFGIPSSRSSTFDDSLSPSSASRPMSIRGSDQHINAPPPLPPPPLVPINGPVDPTLQLKYSSHREAEGSLSDSFGHPLNNSFGRRDPFFKNDIDEGYQSLDTASARSPIDFPSPLGLQSQWMKNFRPCGDAIDRSMVNKLDGRRRLDKSPPRHLSSSTSDISSNRTLHPQPPQLSLPHRTKFFDTTSSFTNSPVMMSSVSQRSTPFTHGISNSTDYRSPIGTEAPDFDRSPLGRSRRTNSGSVPDDITVSSHENRDDELDDSETSRMRRLELEDQWREREREREFYQQVGQKRRASSPPGDDLPLPSDMVRRRDGSILSRGSPTPRLQVIPQGSSLSSLSSARSGSYTSNLTTSSMASLSFGRRSPNAISPGGMSPTDTMNSPYATPISLTTSPRSSISRAVAAQQMHQRTLSSPRKLIELPKSSVGSKMKDPFMCQCCPKKPKKFDTEEELNAHSAEKQYECSFCGSRFKNKNEAERHQNSLHVRRHSWSCSALTGYERAYHESTSRPGEADVCGYCGEEFPRAGPTGVPNQGGRFITDQDWEERIRHLQDVHKFRECNASKKFYRADHFRQHLKHSHAGTSGKWTNMLENACMMDEESPIPGTVGAR